MRGGGHDATSPLRFWVAGTAKAAIAANPRVRWVKRATEPLLCGPPQSVPLGPVRSAPLMGVGGDVIFGSNDGTVWAVRTRGTTSWCWAARRPAYFFAAFALYSWGANWRLLAGDLNGTLWQFDSVTGAQLGSLDLGASLASSPALAQVGAPAAYVGALQTGRLHKVALPALAPLWAFPAGGPVPSSPAVWIDVAGREVVFFGSENGTLWALWGADGSVAWAFPTGGAVVASPSLAAADFEGTKGDALVYVGSMDGSMYALHAGNGTLAWRFRTGGPVQGSAAVAVNCTGVADAPNAPGALFFGADDGFFYGLSLATGAPLWPPLFVQRGVVGAPAVSQVGVQCLVYVGSGDGSVRAANGTSGEWAWRADVGGAVLSSPAIGPEGEVCVGTQDAQGLTGAMVCLEEGLATISGSASASAPPAATAVFTRTPEPWDDTHTQTVTQPRSAAASATPSRSGGPSASAPPSRSSTASASASPFESPSLSPSRSAASRTPSRSSGGSASPAPPSSSGAATPSASASPYAGGALGSGPAAGAPWAQGGRDGSRSCDASGLPVRAAASAGTPAAALFFVDVDSPALMWRAAVGAAVRGGAAVDGRGWVYVGVEGGRGAGAAAGGGVAVVDGGTGVVLSFAPSAYGVRGVPARGGGEVFYAGTDGGVAAWALWGGADATPPLAPAPAPLWRYSPPPLAPAQLAAAPNFAYASPLLLPGTDAVFAASIDASTSAPHLYALNASSGSLLWALPRGGLAVASAPSAAPGGATLYVGTVAGGVAAVRSADGWGAWAAGDAALPPPPGASAPLPVWAPVAVAPDGGTLLAGTSRALWALRAANGALAWNFTPPLTSGSGGAPDGFLPGAPAAAPPPAALALPAGAAAPPFVAYWPSAGTLYALRGDSGAPLWAYVAAASAGAVVAGAPAVAPGGATVLLATTDGYVHAVAAATGAQRWRWGAGQPLWAPPALGLNGWVFVGGAGGDLFALGAAATATASPTESASGRPSASTTPSATASGGASGSPTACASRSPTVSGSATTVASASRTDEPRPTGTASPSSSWTVAPTPSNTPSALATFEPCPTLSNSPAPPSQSSFVSYGVRGFSGAEASGGGGAGAVALAVALVLAAAAAAERGG